MARRQPQSNKRLQKQPANNHTRPIPHRTPRICRNRNCVEFTTNPDGYCNQHKAKPQPARKAAATTDTGLTHAEQQRRVRTVQNWIKTHGAICPGYKRPPHAVDPRALTAEHAHPIAEGGKQSQPLTVLCRSCNSSHGADTANKLKKMQ